MVVNVCNSSGETEAGVSWVQNQSELHNEWDPASTKAKQNTKQTQHMVGGRAGTFSFSTSNA